MVTKNIFILSTLFLFSATLFGMEHEASSSFNAELHYQALKKICLEYSALANIDFSDWHDYMDVLGPRTKQGLLLEIHYGKPLYIWTPWGAVFCKEANFDSTKTALFIEKCRATLHQHLKKTWQEEVGPIYSIQNIEGLLLPEPKEGIIISYLQSPEAARQWQKIAKFSNFS